LVISIIEGVERVTDKTKGVIKMNTSTKIAQGKVVKDRSPAGEETLYGKDVILGILERAAADSEFLARMADDPGKVLQEYYTLTSEEKAALASGDIKKIEGWVGKLDKRLATWLWCRLSQEKY
jgi:hypothetical protein